MRVLISGHCYHWDIHKSKSLIPEVYNKLPQIKALVKWTRPDTSFRLILKT